MDASVSEMKDGSLVKRMMDVNFHGCVNPTIYALPYLKNAAAVHTPNLPPPQPQPPNKTSSNSTSVDPTSTSTVSLKTGGHELGKAKIAVISSGFAFMAGPRRSAYSASKAALKAFYDSLRVEESQTLEITMMYPGVVSTNINKNRLGVDASGNGPNREKRKGAMSSEGCAKVVWDSVRYGKSDEVFTLGGKVGWYLRVSISQVSCLWLR
jgi:short-subunit dehydrogenase